MGLNDAQMVANYRNVSWTPRTNGGLHFIHQEVLEKLRKFNIVPNNYQSCYSVRHRINLP